MMVVGALNSFGSIKWKGQPRPFHRTAEHGELLPKSEILES